MNAPSSAHDHMEETRSDGLAEKLKRAVEAGHTNGVLSLLKMGAPIIIDNDGQTALHLASASGHENVVDALIQAGCDVSIQDFTGHTPLQRAAAEGHLEVLKLLVKNGASVDHQDEVHGNTSLHEAAWKGYSQSVQFLTRVGKANCYMKNRGGFAPLHLCCQNGHNETCRILLFSGCKPDIKNNYGDTPLHTSARYGHAGVVRILVSGKCNPSEQNKNGDTALHISAAMGRRKLTRVLIESGCSKDIKNKQNETALDIASRKNLVDIIQILQSTLPRTSVKRDVSSPAALNAALNAALEEMSSDVDAIKPYPLENKLRRSSRDKQAKKSTNRRRRHSGGSEDVDGGQQLWSSPYAQNHGREPKLQDFAPDLKGLTSDPLQTGEQYFLDLAGNIRKGPVAALGRDCVCSPLIKKMERRLERDKKDIVRKINGTTSKLDSRITHLEKKTKDHLFSLNQAMKESFANERGECMDRMDRRALRERIAIERQQVLRDLSLKRDLAAWLESKLTEIEKKHGLDAKNAALLRTMAMKRFSKYRRSHRKLLNTDDILGPSLRRAHSEELLSEICGDDDEDPLEALPSKKQHDLYKGLKVSDRPATEARKGSRLRRNSAGDESSVFEDECFRPSRFTENSGHDEQFKAPCHNYYSKSQVDLHSTNSESCNEQSDHRSETPSQRSESKRLSSYEDDKNVYENTMMGGGGAQGPKEILRPIPTSCGIPVRNPPTSNEASRLSGPPPYGHHASRHLGSEDAQQYRRELNHVQRQLFPPTNPQQAFPAANNNINNNQRVPVPSSSFNANYPSRSIRPMSPLDEDDYVGPNEVSGGEKEDFHRQLLNIPMTSDGGGSHDSHNDSGYSTRLGFSAGPSPSLSGSRPESSEGDHPHYQNTAPAAHLLLDPMAINMMPPELEQLSHHHRTITNGQVSSRIQEINQQLRLVDIRSSNGGGDIPPKTAPKGSLV